MNKNKVGVFSMESIVVIFILELLIIILSLIVG